MSEKRTPMKPALGLVKGRLEALPPARRKDKPIQQSASVDPAIDARTPSSLDKDAKPAAPVVKDTKSKRSTRPKPSEATGGMKRTTLSLPQELVDLLVERRRNTPRVSQVQIILNCLAATRTRLKELIDADNAGAQGNDLFPVTSTTRTAVEKRTTISFDTAEENMKIIDTLVEVNGAASRSQLVRVALREVLEA